MTARATACVLMMDVWIHGRVFNCYCKARCVRTFCASYRAIYIRLLYYFIIIYTELVVRDMTRNISDSIRHKLKSWLHARMHISTLINVCVPSKRYAQMQ